MTEKQIKQFFNDVMINERIYGWSLNFTTDYFCWLRFKTKHTQFFWKQMKLLTNKYLKCDLDENNKNHKKYSTNGIYSLKYQ